MDFLYSLDLAVFYFFNHTISTGFLDRFFSIITDVSKWYIAYIILVGMLFLRVETRENCGYRINSSDCRNWSDRLQNSEGTIWKSETLLCTGWCHHSCWLCRWIFLSSNHALNNLLPQFFFKIIPKLQMDFFSCSDPGFYIKNLSWCTLPFRCDWWCFNRCGIWLPISIAALKLEQYLRKRNELANK